MTKKEIKNWILENCVNINGDIDLSGLDFSDFTGDIYISGWKVKNDLYQNYQEVNGYLFQNYQKVKECVIQCFLKVGGDLEQESQEVCGNLYQNKQDVNGKIIQDKTIKGKTYPQELKKLKKKYGWSNKNFEIF